MPSISTSQDELVNWIREKFSCELIESDQEITLIPSRIFKGTRFKISKQYLQELFIRYELVEIEDFMISGAGSFEALIDLSSDRIARNIVIKDMNEIVDGARNRTYKIGKPGDIFCLYLIFNMMSMPRLRPYLIGARYNEIDSQERVLENAEVLLELTEKHAVNLYSFKLAMGNSSNRGTMLRIFDSFRFHLAYNLGISITNINSVDKLFRTFSATRKNTIERQVLEAPQRRYLPDLVYHYQLGISAKEPFTQYISYYHVLEHFFDDVYHENIVSIFRDRITHPGFSYNNKSQVKSLLKKLRNEISIRDDAISPDEKTSLGLTISKYVNMPELIESINALDDDVRDQYRGRLTFCDAAIINVTEGHDNIVKSLASRIYSIRNAVVHSKDNDKLRYVPFRHDNELAKEIPMIKLIAEQVIISTSDIS